MSCHDVDHLLSDETKARMIDSDSSRETASFTEDGNDRKEHLDRHLLALLHVSCISDR